MSKINCNVAEDLIPLYVDEVLTSDSVELVEEHLAECEDCTAKVESLRKETVIVADKDVNPLKKVRSKLKFSKIITIVLITAFVLFGIHVFLNYLKLIHFDYSYDEVKDDLIIVSMSDYPASGSENVFLVYDREDKVFSADCMEEVVGIKDGKMQIEVTLYMTSSAYNRYIEAWNPFSPDTAMDDDKPYLLYDTSLLGGSISDDVNYKNYENYNYCGVGSVLCYDIDRIGDNYEIVAIYYGKWDYNKDCKPEAAGERHLLWEKN